MRSVSWYNCGNANLRGKLSRRLMAGKHVEEVLVNHKPALRNKIALREMNEVVS